MASTFVSSLRRRKTTLNLILAEDSRLAACSVAVLFLSNERSYSDAQGLKGSRLRSSHAKLHFHAGSLCVWRFSYLDKHDSYKIDFPIQEWVRQECTIPSHAAL
jgi:bisphosphoglycerate-dependent phosphoglycerate mutase